MKPAKNSAIEALPGFLDHHVDIITVQQHLTIPGVIYTYCCHRCNNTHFCISTSLGIGITLDLSPEDAAKIGQALIEPGVLDIRLLSDDHK